MSVENIVLITISLINTVNFVVSQNFEGFVVDGQRASIRDFPHTALLSIECETQAYNKEIYTCGASILNQAILITAAHCLENCIPRYTFVTAFVGSKVRMGGTPHYGSGFKLHEKYDTHEICNDIALVKLMKFLKFGKTVRRVALMRNTPYKHTASVAGWGLIDEKNQISSSFLMQTSQRIWTRRECVKELGNRLPKGVICGGEVDTPSYVAPGDSGSALMVRKYIQVGLVSFKVPNLTPSLAVYTEVAYFYDWIKETAKKMYCNHDKLV